LGGERHDVQAVKLLKVGVAQDRDQELASHCSRSYLKLNLQFSKVRESGPVALQKLDDDLEKS
jgi:hypothetical protein